jgi:antitoxin (DNA-binding transcriptional repressor) of toxin-antitoxin stability system
MYDFCMAVIHISEAEAARDFASLLARVQAGEEIVIDSGERAVAVLRPAEPERRTISESLVRAKARSEERGYKAIMDDDFAADMREIIANRKPRDTSAWD